MSEIEQEQKPMDKREKWTLAEKLKSEGLLNKEIAKQIGVSPGRVSQVMGKRRTKSESNS